MGRYDGEEFLLAMPCTTLAQANKVLERLRECIQSTAWADVFAGASGVTVTIGAAACPPGEPVESAIRHADAALYEGKAAGRNRVVLAPLCGPQAEFCRSG